MKSFKTLSHFALTVLLMAALFSCSDDASTPSPVITGFSPTSGAEGTTVIITGSNFSATASDNNVTFNGTDAAISAATVTSLTVTVPAGATTGKIAVRVKGSETTSADDFTVIQDPYAGFRVKEVQEEDTWKTDYYYDANNRLTSAENYTNDKTTSTYFLESTTTYNYDETGALVKYVVIYPVSNVAVKVDYSYSGGQLQQKIISQATLSGGSPGAYTVLTMWEYTIVDQQISAATIKDGSNKVLDQMTYTYSTTGGDPQTLIHHLSGGTWDAISVFYADVIDPDPTPDPENTTHHLLKTYVLTSNHKFDYSNAYTSDDLGRLDQYTSSYPNSPSYSGTLTYVYEAKP